MAAAKPGTYATTEEYVPHDAERRAEVPVRESSRIEITKRVIYTFSIEESMLDDIANILGMAEHYDLSLSQQRTRAEFREALDVFYTQPN